MARGKKIGGISIFLTAHTKAFKKSVDSANKRLKKFGKSVVAIGKKIAVMELKLRFLWGLIAALVIAAIATWLKNRIGS